MSLNFLSDKINHGSTSVGSYQYDHHTLLIEYNGCDKERVHQILGAAFKQMYTKVHKTKMTEGRVPYILNESKPTCCYVYIVSPNDYNVLIGLNPDGTSRDRVVGSDNKSEEYKRAMEEADGDWGLMSEVEDKFSGSVVHEPLIDVPGYVFVRAENWSDWQTLAKPGEIAAMRAWAKPANGGCVTNRLIVNGFADVEQARIMTSIYSNNPQYPLVKACPWGARVGDIEITYDPASRDGIFAFYMVNKAKLKTGKIVRCSYFREKL